MGIVPKEFRDELAWLQLLVAGTVVAIVSGIFVASAFGLIDSTNPTVQQSNTLFLAIAGGATWFIYDAAKKIQEAKLRKQGGSQETTGPPS